MTFCFMQKFVDLRKIGTKVPIITAFALDHVRGFVFVEAEKACDVTEVHNLFLNFKRKEIHSCWQRHAGRHVVHYVYYAITVFVI